jgi:hypothetical protein
LSLSRSSTPRRGAVALGLAAALVFVPGVALAAPGDPVGEVTTDPAQLLEDIVGGGAGDSGAVADETGTAPEADAPEGLPGPEDLPSLDTVLQELGGALGLSDECVTGIQDSLDTTAGGLTGAPAELQALLAEFQTGLQTALESQDFAALDAFLAEVFGSGDESADAPLPLGQDILAGLEELAATLPACQPALPGGGGTGTPPATPPAAPSPQQPPAVTPVPATVAPVAQPVAYLGYAPTGADTAEAADTSVPLTVLGGGLVLLAAGAAGYGLRGRAALTRD